MPSCEKCWADSYTPHGFDHGKYTALMLERKCTAEEQAGAGAKFCGACDKRAVHQFARVCMNCGWRKGA